MNLFSFVTRDMVSVTMSARTRQEAIKTIVSTLRSGRAPVCPRDDSNIRPTV